MSHARSIALAAVFLSAGACGATESSPPLALEKIIPLPGVAGRIDHLAIDLKTKRLFVAELGNGTVDAIDLAQGASAGRIGGLSEPQGLAYLPETGELAVASGGDGTVRFYKGADLAPVTSLKVGEDADNLRVAADGSLVVGYGSGALGVIDPHTHRLVRSLTLTGHPESFRLDGARAFVNVPGRNVIAVGDLATARPVATWKSAHMAGYPMAFDASSKSLAIVYRLPARLSVLDSQSGAAKADIATCGDADDVFFDDLLRRLYVVCGSGAVDVFEAQPQWRSMARVPTREGARTGLFAPELNRLFVAARATAGQPAAIMVLRPTAADAGSSR